MLSTSNGTAIAGVNYQPISQVGEFFRQPNLATVGIPIIQQSNATPDTTRLPDPFQPGRHHDQRAAMWKR